VRICIIGKYPPIQGGVSMRTYRVAHALGARGHDVHVVTNAKEVRPPFRMHMRAEDWERCEARYESGSVTVHWTDPIDGSQSYIPMASPFVTKLAGIAAKVNAERPFDVIYSHYLEPYGVAGHLAAQMTGVPHVARMAGSDAGRLWHHPQFEALYDHVLRSAEIVIAAGTVAARARERGIAPERIVHGGQFVVPEDLFTPEGSALDLAALRAEVATNPELQDLMWGGFRGDRPYFGVCGKLGERKGSFALLDTMEHLARAGLEVGLVALAHGQPDVEKRFRSRAQKLGLADRILQIPFLPHWRVPEFLRGCLAVCCLEQDFPIGFHTPMIPFEVLLCGTCLVASTEVIAKLPGYGRLPHGYGCVAIEDVDDIEELTAKLTAIIEDPRPAAAVGARGRAFARELQTDAAFPRPLERILEAATLRQSVSSRQGEWRADASTEPQEQDFPLTRLAEIAIQKAGENAGLDERAPSSGTIDLARARDVLAALRRLIEAGQPDLESIASAVQIEVAIAIAETEANTSDRARSLDELFRLQTRRWAMDEHDLAELSPLRNPQLRLLTFDFDVSEFMMAKNVADLPRFPTRHESHIVAFSCARSKSRSPLVVDAVTAQILKLSDGSQTVSKIIGRLGEKANGASKVNNLDWIEGLFVEGLIWLLDKPVGAPTPDGHPTQSQVPSECPPTSNPGPVHHEKY
jgi:glycosyltransferase involved in cell wall biosynthesis